MTRPLGKNFRLAGGSDLASALETLESGSQLVISYRSGPTIGLLTSDTTVSAHMFAGGGIRPALDPALEPLRSHLLSHGWTQESDPPALVRTWPASTDPESMFDELIGIFVIAYSVRPRHLWARVVLPEPLSAALPYLILYAIFFVVPPAVIGVVLGLVVAERIAAESRLLFAIAGGVAAAVTANVILLGGMWLWDRLRRD